MQSPSYRFKEAARCDFDGMFCAGSVETRYFAGSKIHAGHFTISFFFRYFSCSSFARLTLPVAMV